MSNHSQNLSLYERLQALPDEERRAWYIALFIALASVGAFVLAGLNEATGFFQPRHPWGPDLTIMRVGLVTVGGLSGFCLGWLFSGHGQMFRMIIALALIGIAGSIVIFDHGALGWGTAWLLAFIGFVAGLGYWTRRFVERIRELPTTLGSALWATEEHLDENNVVGSAGFQLGYFKTSTALSPLHYDGDRHMATIAPNRSMKGTASIIPNLLTYEGSVMVIDPKGENAMITADRREALGQDVHVVDPWGITGMDIARFNPMDWLVQSDPDIGENSLMLADAIIMMESQSDPFFDHSAKAFLDGVILYVATDEEEAGQRHLGRVRDLLMFDGLDLETLFKRMLKSPHHKVRSMGSSMLNKEPKLLSNILASVQAQTNFLDSVRIRESLSVSDFDFADLKTKPMSIYLVLPSDRLNAYGRWLRLLIQQALTVNARNIEQKPEKSVLFVLDEMPALGKLTMVEQAFGLMAGFGIQIHAICQDASQLKRIYGDSWETFISNAGVIQYFGSRDSFTAEYFSKLCGVTTVWNFTTAVARAFGRTSGNTASTSTTETTTDTAAGIQRKLAYPDELMRLPKDRQLILIENLNPIIATKVPWFKNDELKELGRNLHAEAEAAKASTA